MSNNISIGTPATANDQYPQFKLGSVLDTCDPTLGAQKWVYVKYIDAVTYAAGHVLQWANAAGTSVTNDRSGGSAINTTGNRTAGICPGVMTQNYHGWMLVSGECYVLGDGSVAAGEAVVADTADGKADSMADGEEEQVFGTALEDDDATTALFRCKVTCG